MDKRFLKAFLTPSRTLLCGYRLYPWCIKHRLWLEALDHPLLRGRPCTPEELLFFAKVCSETNPTRSGLRDWWQGVRLRDPANLYVELARAYDHMRVDCWPQFWDKSETKDSSGGGRNRGMPWAMTIILNLTKGGVDLETALNLPESQAIWLSTGMSIQAGASLDILTSDDEELLDQLARVRESETPRKPEEQ